MYRTLKVHELHFYNVCSTPSHNTSCEQSWLQTAVETKEEIQVHRNIQGWSFRTYHYWINEVWVAAIGDVMLCDSVYFFNASSSASVASAGIL